MAIWYSFAIMENRNIKLIQLEVSLHFVEKQVDNRDWVARTHADPSTREEARIEAGQKRQEAKKICREIEELM
jgi:hypothetical protein